MRSVLLVIITLLISQQLFANEVSIEHTKFTQKGSSWRVDTTLLHEDTGWEHYADAWRVVDEKGNELGKRVLFHPHETEQPFTRSLSGLKIPSNLTIVFVEAHDKVHGWSKNKVKVDLTKTKGAKYEVFK